MRQYEKFEWSKEKCMICGCRNKIHSELFEDVTDKFLGYSLKCCACGHMRLYFNEHSYNGLLDIPKFHIGHQKCYRRSFCPHKDCLLYSEKEVPERPDEFEPLPNKDLSDQYRSIVSSYDLGTSFEDDCPCTRYEISNSNKLVVNESEDCSYI
jgi:hypothetical protein